MGKTVISGNIHTIINNGLSSASPSYQSSVYSPRSRHHRNPGVVPILIYSPKGMNKTDLTVCLRYTLHLAKKRNKHLAVKLYSVGSGGALSEVNEQDYIDGKINEIYVNIDGEKGKKADTPKSVYHYYRDGKLQSEYRNNGKKSHSAEVEMSVVLNLLEGPGGDRMNKDQKAEDDGNFWKNPVNQTDQIKFAAEDSSKTRTRYGGHITWEELQKHNKPEDAWICIEGKVYDVTKYAPIHPGGKKINLGFGKDGTELFKKYHSWVNTDAIIGKCFIGILE